MNATNIPYLYNRNGIFYYRTRSRWQSLRTRNKAEAFERLCKLISDTVSSNSEFADKSYSYDAAVASTESEPQSRAKIDLKPLVCAYLNENAGRWAIREQTRVKSILKYLPVSLCLDALQAKQQAIELKQRLLKQKTSATLNRYLKYFNAFFRWVIANNSRFTVNPFDGLSVRVNAKPVQEQRKAYTFEQIKQVLALADKQGKESSKYWLIYIARYTGMRINEVCQLRPEDVTEKVIHIRGERLKTVNALRDIPTHPKLIELGLLDFVKCHRNKFGNDRLMNNWAPVKGSYSHNAGRWFARNKPFGGLDFHSIRHTVATEFKVAGVPAQYAAQILGHSNGNITYDRYGKSVMSKGLVSSIGVIGK